MRVRGRAHACVCGYAGPWCVVIGDTQALSFDGMVKNLGNVGLYYMLQIRYRTSVEFPWDSTLLPVIMIYWFARQSNDYLSVMESSRRPYLNRRE